ncbi:phage tail protein [Agromyces sp. NPDC058104]|uniref:phage tail protein n=1 Tax=Agromyces sp. NPDC058104 TaxID=3346342 RepID=UPI0036DE9789
MTETWGLTKLSGGVPVKDFDVLWNNMIDQLRAALDLINARIPVGGVMFFAGTAAPEGWLFAEGQQVSRTTYATLFSRLGTTYGAGNGTSTFHLPNLKGRTPVGYDTSQAEFNAMGKKGGAKTHTLTAAQMPTHSHRVIGGNNSTTRLYSAQATILGISSGGARWAAWFGSGWNGADNVKTTDVGGSDPHNNLQPYIALRAIIKVK